MRLKDLVANSLPRVRGRKGKRSSQPQNQITNSHQPQGSEIVSNCQQTFNHNQENAIAPSHAQPVFESRESSVERSSTVAVVDAPWRENAAYHGRSKPDDLSLVAMGGSLSYCSMQPKQQRGMVMSHSADGIASSHSAMATFMTSQRDAYFNQSESGGMVASHYVSNSALPNSMVTYMGPGYVYHSQHQHQHYHHHHHHSHRDYHYIYHHHHHDRHHHYPTNAQQQTAGPLGERNPQCISSSVNTNPNSSLKHSDSHQEKSERTGFFRRSFASFRAMRKQSRKNKHEKEQHVDENDKFASCPQPQKRDSSHKKVSKPTKWRKSKHSTGDEQGDACWHSDSEAKIVDRNHRIHHNQTDIPYATINRFPIRECSISRHQMGSHDAMDAPSLENVSLSGYESDASKNRSVRPRSRIKTNPWLPSPQPSLSLGRRINNDRSHDLMEDAMEEEVPNSFPRSASFDYHRQLGVSTFLSSSGQDHKRNGVQRHRSLTPVDLKLNFSLPRTKKLDEPPAEQSQSTNENNNKSILENSHMNDLNTKRPKSRPNSILSPNSEFIALADNIEQLANNISFEYEDTCPNCSTKSNNLADHDCCNSMIHAKESLEETSCKKRRSDSTLFPAQVTTPDNANSPDSGIGCLGSCDGDDVSNSNVDSQDVCTSSTSTPMESAQNFSSGNVNVKICKNQNCQNACCARMEGRNVQKLNKDFNFMNDDQNCKLRNGKVCSLPLSRKSSQNSRSLIGSSSSESLISGAEVSESDIDNTSYNKCIDDHVVHSVLVVDLPRSRHSPGTVRIEERSEHDFRSLPWKIRGIGYKQKRLEDESNDNEINFDNEKCFTSLDRKECKNSDKQNSENLDYRDKNIRNFDSVKDIAKNNLQSDKAQYKLESKNTSLDQLCREETELKMLTESFERQNVQVVSAAQKTRTIKNGDGFDGDLSRDAVSTKTDDVNGYFNQSCKNDQPTISKKTQPSCELSMSVQMDMTDACVQTDFGTDFELWDSSSGLSPLDDSFDPAESTRRWLMWGNMQGSADTGYSSQPRDSHVFQDDDANMVMDDGLSDAGSGNHYNPFNSQQASNKMAADLSPSSANKHPLFGHSDVVCSSMAQQSHQNLDKQPDPTHGVAVAQNTHPEKDKSFTESAFYPGSNPKPVVRRESNLNDETDPSKRHSSDSSTSTLTSDLQTIDVEEGVGTSSIIEGFESGSWSSSHSNLSHDVKDHDYVNLPVRNFSLLQKSKTSIQSPICPTKSKNRDDVYQNSGVSKLDCKNEFHENRHDSSQFANLKTIPSSNPDVGVNSVFHVNDQTSIINDDNNLLNFKNDSKHFKDNTKHHMEAFQRVEEELIRGVVSNENDRADYLEFLKDASLSSTNVNNHGVFIVPGFGPLELPGQSSHQHFPHRIGRENSSEFPRSKNDKMNVNSVHRGAERRGGNGARITEVPDNRDKHSHKSKHSTKRDSSSKQMSIVGSRDKSSRKMEKSAKVEKSSGSKNSCHNQTNNSNSSRVENNSSSSSLTTNVSNNRPIGSGKGVASSYPNHQQSQNKSGIVPPQVPAKPRHLQNQSHNVNTNVNNTNVNNSNSKHQLQTHHHNDTGFNKHDPRCPTVQSYDLELDPYKNYPSRSGVGVGFQSALPTQNHAGPGPVKQITSVNLKDAGNNDSARSIAERVSFLEKEKEIIYRQIQELQQQQHLSRQQQHVQRHRSAHSRRKEELLDTLRDLKVKLEEQSKRLQTASQEEV